MIPLAKKGPPFRLILCAIFGSLAGNGCFETGVAGTATTTGNTVSARVVLSDGNPAAGATVSLRQSGFIPPGVPGFQGGSELNSQKFRPSRLDFFSFRYRRTSPFGLEPTVMLLKRVRVPTSITLTVPAAWFVT